jgi:hypothetical protein
LLLVLSSCREARPSEHACEAVVSRWEAHGRSDVGDQYGDFIAARRAQFVGACRSYGSQEYVDCAAASADFSGLARCVDGALQAPKSRDAGDAPTAADCEAQANHRLALHAHLELPSIARGLEETRPSMVKTCNEYWSAAYVDCLLGSPSLSHVQACETVGRVRQR